MREIGDFAEGGSGFDSPNPSFFQRCLVESAEKDLNLRRGLKQVTSANDVAATDSKSLCRMSDTFIHRCIKAMVDCPSALSRRASQ